MVTVESFKSIFENVECFVVSYIDKRGYAREYQIPYYTIENYVGSVPFMDHRHFLTFVVASLMSTGLKFIQTRRYMKAWLRS